MWNPFSFIQFLFTIAKEAPDPINVQFEEPSANLLPDELKSQLKIEGFYVSQLWIENLSKKVLGDVRINLSSPLEYTPIVRTNKRHGKVDYKYDYENMELLIFRIDPSESLKLSFFPEIEKIEYFEKPQIIVKDKELSSLMTQLGLYRKYPSLLATYVLMMVSVVVATGGIGFAAYLELRDNQYLFPNSDYTILSQANERLSKYGCPLIVKENTEDLQLKLHSQPYYSISTIMEINGVQSENALWAKEKIAFIECNPQ